MRFISEDSNKGDVKDPLSLNLYTYCEGNSIRLVDVDGHAGRDVQSLINQDGSSLTGGGGEVVYYLLDWLIKEGATVKDALRISYFLATTYYPSMTSTDTVFSDRAVEWTNHGYKHFPQKNMSWNDVIKSTKNGPAKYASGINIESLERMVWEKGTPVTNGKTWRVMKFDYVVGASDGVETMYMRVEMSGGTIHGHPITKAEYLKLIK